MITLVTGCSGQLRKPALAIGGALTVGGIAFAAHAGSRDCNSGELGSDWNCAGEAVGGTVLGLILAGIGTGLLVGAALGGGGEDSRDSRTPAPQPAPAPTPVAEAPTDPANPPPAMEPEPAQW